MYILAPYRRGGGHTQCNAASTDLLTASSNVRSEHDMHLSQLDRALLCSRRMDLRGAILELEAALEVSASQSGHDRAQLLALLSKQWTDHTYIDGVTPQQVMRVNERAEDLAKQAQEADDTFSLGFCAECICKGRMAVAEPNPRRCAPSLTALISVHI